MIGLRRKQNRHVFKSMQTHWILKQYALLCSLFPFIFAWIPGCSKKSVENASNPPGAVCFWQANDMTNVAGCIPIASVLVWFPKLETWFRTRTTGSTKHSPKATGVLNRRDGGGLPGKWRFTSHFTRKSNLVKCTLLDFELPSAKIGKCQAVAGPYPMWLCPTWGLLANPQNLDLEVFLNASCFLFRVVASICHDLPINFS